MHIGKIRADKNKPYSIYIVSTKENMMYILNNINGFIRLKVPGFKESCNLYNIDYIEANYNIGLYDPYFAGLVDTDGSIVFNYAGNRIECNLEFQYNEYSSKLNFDNTILSSKPTIIIRKKSSNLGGPLNFSSIAFKFQNVNSMLFIYDYFMHNRLYCDMNIGMFLIINLFFSNDICIILSKFTLCIQPAGNQQVSTNTLVGSSETARQLSKRQEEPHSLFNKSVAVYTLFSRSYIYFILPILGLIFSNNKEVLVSQPHRSFSDKLPKSAPERVSNLYNSKLANLTSRAYSTVSNSSNKKEGSPSYFKTVKSKHPSSPNGIVTNFHIKYNTPELANPHITYELIKNILDGTLDGFGKVMNKGIFKQLKELAESSPVVFNDLPLQGKELVRFTFNAGPASQITLNNRISIRSGVYV